MTRICLSFIALACCGSAVAQPSRAALETRVAQAPADADARLALSDLLTAEGQTAAAVPHLTWLAQHAPGDLALHRRLAQTLLWTDQPARAAEVLAQVVALDPTDTDARVQIAEIVTWDGGADRAVALLAPVADAHPDDARLHRILAFAMLASDHPDARRQLTRALALAPTDADLLVEGGAAERWQGDWSLAQARLWRALGQSLTDPQRARVRTLLDGIRDVSAATITTAAVRTSDSNGITRTDSPGRLTVPVNGRWTVGAEVGRGQIEDATRSSVGAAFVPFVVYRPSQAVQVHAAAGVEGTPGGRLAGHARASVQRVWAGDGFALARLSAATATATDAVDALDQGLYRSGLTAEGYAEPSSAVSVSGQLGGLFYSDGNRRVQASAAARWLPLSVGRRAEGLPLASVGVTAGALYEDTATLYPTSAPYFTPDDLLTTSVGLAARVVTAAGLRLDGTLGAAHQSGGSTSMEYGAAVEWDRGTEAVRLELRRTGSSAYSSDTVGLTVRVRLP